jgi:DNA-directed RNA polymerase specialized sigma24 family protein
MNELDVTKTVDRLFLLIRQEDLAKQTGLTAAARDALEHEVTDTMRRVCYQRRDLGERAEDISEELGVSVRTVNRYIREYAASHRLRVPRSGPQKGDEVIKWEEAPRP